MEVAVRSVIVALVLFLSGCSLDQLTPDAFTVGVIQHEADGYWSDSNGSFGNGRADGLSYGAALRWDIGPARPTHETDFLRQEVMLTNVVTTLAEKMPKPTPPVINVGDTSPEKILLPHPTSGDKALSWFEWYGEASLWVQAIIALLALAVLLTVFFLRKSLVNMLRYLVFWRTGKAPDGDENVAPTDANNSS